MTSSQISPDRSIPVTVLTGFLGSGKTTVLNRLLSRPGLDGTVAIINEFGEIGLDHLLIEKSEESFALLDNGCVCCTIRGDLSQTLVDLKTRLAAGELKALDRIVIETTGLADPAPILHTLMADDTLIGNFHIDGVVVTVDAVNGAATLANHTESTKQAAVADRLLVTKADLADTDAINALIRGVRAHNGTAPIRMVTNGEVDPKDIFELGLFDAQGKSPDVERWLHEAAAGAHDHDHGQSKGHGHDHDHASEGAHAGGHAHAQEGGIRSYSAIIDEPVDWAAFSHWLELVAAMRGDDMLRFKGIVRVSDHPDRPVVVHGVQHVFHPPRMLEEWPSDDHRTRLVFIVRDIPAETIENTLSKFARIDAPRLRPAAGDGRHLSRANA